jgi:hypothetical protein
MRPISNRQYAAVRQRKNQRAMEVETRGIEQAAQKAAELASVCLECDGECRHVAAQEEGA